MICIGKLYTVVCNCDQESQGRLSSKLVFHQRSSSFKVLLLSNVIFHINVIYKKGLTSIVNGHYALESKHRVQRYLPKGEESPLFQKNQHLSILFKILFYYTPPLDSLIHYFSQFTASPSIKFSCKVHWPFYILYMKGSPAC